MQSQHTDNNDISRRSRESDTLGSATSRRPRVHLNEQGDEGERLNRCERLFESALRRLLKNPSDAEQTYASRMAAAWCVRNCSKGGKCSISLTTWNVGHVVVCDHIITIAARNGHGLLSIHLRAELQNVSEEETSLRQLCTDVDNPTFKAFLSAMQDGEIETTMPVPEGLFPLGEYPLSHKYLLKVEDRFGCVWMEVVARNTPSEDPPGPLDRVDALLTGVDEAHIDALFFVLGAVLGLGSNPFAPNVVMLWRARSWVDVIVVFWDIALKALGSDGQRVINDAMITVNSSLFKRGGDRVVLQSLDFIPESLRSLDATSLTGAVAALVTSPKAKALYVLIREFMAHALGVRIGIDYSTVINIANSGLKEDPDTMLGAVVAVTKALSSLANADNWQQALSLDSTSGSLIARTVIALEQRSFDPFKRPALQAAQAKEVDKLISEWKSVADTNSAMRSATVTYLPLLTDKLKCLRQVLRVGEKPPGLCIVLDGAPGVGKTTISNDMAQTVRLGYGRAFTVDVSSEPTIRVDLSAKYADSGTKHDPLVIVQDDALTVGGKLTQGAEQEAQVLRMVYAVGDKYPIPVPGASVQDKDNYLNSVVSLILTLNREGFGRLLSSAADVNAVKRRTIYVKVCVKEQYAKGKSLDESKLDGTNDYWEYEVDFHCPGVDVHFKTDNHTEYLLKIQEIYFDHFNRYIEGLRRESREPCGICGARVCACVAPVAALQASPGDLLMHANFSWKHVAALSSVFGPLEAAKIVGRFALSHFIVAMPWLTEITAVEGFSALLFFYTVGWYFSPLFLMSILAYKGVQVDVFKQRGLHPVFLFLPIGAAAFFMWWKRRCPSVVAASESMLALQGTISSRPVFARVATPANRPASRDMHRPVGDRYAAVAYNTYELEFHKDGKMHMNSYGFVYNGALLIPRHCLQKGGTGTYTLVAKGLTTPPVQHERYVKMSDFVRMGHDLLVLHNFCVSACVKLGSGEPAGIILVDEDGVAFHHGIESKGTSYICYPNSSKPVPVLTYDYEQAGLCGSPVYDDEGGVLGIHVAKAGDRGCAQAIEPMPNSSLRCIAQFERPSKNVAATAVSAMGAHYLGTTAERGSILRSKFKPIPGTESKASSLELTVPGRYNGRMVGGKWMTPITPWIELKLPSRGPSLEILSSVTEDLNACVSDFFERTGFPRRPLTLMESVNGPTDSNGRKLMPALNMKTSGGIGYPDKSAHFDLVDDVYVPKLSIISDYDTLRRQLIAQDVSGCNIRAANKDEVVSVKKDSEAKVRQIFVLTLPLGITIRSIFGGVIEGLKTHRLFSVGMNVFGNDWPSLVDRVTRTGKVGNGDFKGFDRSGTTPMALAVWGILRDLARNNLQLDADDELVMSGIIKAVTAPMVMYGGDLYMLEGVNPSGAPTTTIYNCIVVLVILYRACEIAGVRVEDIDGGIFGDDSTFCLDGGLTQLHIRDAAKEYGYTYTDANKGEKLSEYTTHVEFLKRTPVDNPELGVVAGLDWKSIWKSLLFDNTGSTLSFFDRRSSCVSNASMEAALWGEDKYNEFVRELTELYEGTPVAFSLSAVVPYERCVELFRERRYTELLFKDYERIAGAEFHIE